MGRSSFAIAMKDYTFIRPGIAVTISAATLVAALVIGVGLIRSLQRASTIVQQGALTVQALHRYNAGLEVWREMATSQDPAYKRPEAVAQRDSIRRALQSQLARLAASMRDSSDQELVRTILTGLASTDVGIGTAARQAMIVLLANQDRALFEAAETSQGAVFLSAVLLALTVLAAGLLVVPMAWLYIRYKRGATIEVKL
jgi:prophage DNA circulation protein